MFDFHFGLSKLTVFSNNHIQDVLVISYLANTIRTQIDLSQRLATAALTMGPADGLGGTGEEGGRKGGRDGQRSAKGRGGQRSNRGAAENRGED